MTELPTCCPDLAQWLSPRLFKALSDPNRVAILATVAEGGREISVGQVAARFPLDVSVVSRHLALLREAGVLASQKKGKQVFYRVRVAEMAAMLRGLADALEVCCAPGRPGKLEQSP
jgi:DNA-binding transcriptional ArsR family regulator